MTNPIQSQGANLTTPILSGQNLSGFSEGRDLSDYLFTEDHTWDHFSATFTPGEFDMSWLDFQGEFTRQ